MGGSQAAKVMTQIEVASLKRTGEEANETIEKEIFERIKSKYDNETSAYYAAARLWVDEIIDPRKTREYISMSLKVANHAPYKKI